MKKRLLAVGLSVLMLLTLIPTALAASDIAGHWAEKYITYLNKEGIYNPNSKTGEYEPNRDMTRAEFMRYVNRAFHFTETAPINYTDVEPTTWYYETVQIAKKYGYINGVGDNKMDPEGEITREQVATIIGRLFKEDPGTVKPENLSFKDKANVSSWSAAYIKSAVENGFLVGYKDGTFLPKHVISRAEVAKILYFYLGSSLSEEGKAYTGTDLKSDTANATISESCSLSDAEIKGDLYITEGVGTNSVTLTNVKVKGSIIISGGTVTMTNTTSDHMVVSSPMGRLLQATATGASHIGKTTVLSSSGLYERGLTTEGYEGFADVTVESSDGEALTVTLGAALSNLTLDGNATVSMAAGSSIYTLTTKDAATVSGYGTIYQANIQKNGVTISMIPSGYTLADGVTATINGSKVTTSTAATTTVTPATITVDLNDLTALGKEVALTIPSGLTVSSATMDSTILSPSTSYSASSSGINLLTSYLSTLSEGGHTLTLVFSNGKRATVAVTVTNSNIHAGAETLTFDRYYKSSGFQDIAVTVSDLTDAAEISSVILGMTPLDYEVNTSQHKVVLRRGTLGRMLPGAYTVTISLSSGKKQLAVLTVNDSAPTGLSYQVARYDTYNPVEQAFPANLLTHSVVSITSDKGGASQSLAAGTDYMVSGNTIKLTKAGLERFRVSGSLVEFKVTFSDNEVMTLIVDYV